VGAGGADWRCRPHAGWAGPSSAYRRFKRHTERTDRPNSSAASMTATSPAMTRVNTHARRCSIVVIVIVSLMAGD
jgi:hypothetical protein